MSKKSLGGTWTWKQAEWPPDTKYLLCPFVGSGTCISARKISGHHRVILSLTTCIPSDKQASEPLLYLQRRRKKECRGLKLLDIASRSEREGAGTSHCVGQKTQRTLLWCDEQAIEIHFLSAIVHENKQICTSSCHSGPSFVNEDAWACSRSFHKL